MPRARATEVGSEPAPVIVEVLRHELAWRDRHLAAVEAAADLTGVHARLRVLVEHFGRQVGATAAALVVPRPEAGGRSLHHLWGDGDLRHLDATLAVGDETVRTGVATHRRHALQGGHRAVVLAAPVLSGGVAHAALCAAFRGDPRVTDRTMQIARAYGTTVGIARAAGEEIAQLRAEANIDGVTGCLNHRGVREFLADELRRCERRGHSLACCMLDLDGFKAINDKHGHLEGDAVLRGVGVGLHAAVRTYDRVGRYGGDEFLVVMPEADLAVAAVIVDRLLAVVHDVGHRAGFPLAASAGTSCWRPGGSEIDVIGDADRAMLEAKHARPESRQRARDHAGGHPDDSRPQ